MGFVRCSPGPSSTKGAATTKNYKFSTEKKYLLTKRIWRHRKHPNAEKEQRFKHISIQNIIVMNVLDRNKK